MISSWLPLERVTIEVTPFVKPRASQLPSCLRFIASAVPRGRTRNPGSRVRPGSADRAVKSPGARAGFRAPNVSPIGERELVRPVNNSVSVRSDGEDSGGECCGQGR